ncbi:MAG: 50S ribosomal protein L4 [Dehalococcoidia bacterium]|nr:50S ribosomal protein L4 [Dehalococcoidia bacterium]
MDLEIFNLKGEKTGKITVSDYVFGETVNEAVVHQTLVMQLANRRQGTADTQTRSDVKRSTKKLFAQKHTGRARRGAATSALLKGGSVVFGPHPRNYRQDMPKKMRRLALRSVLSGKVRDGEIKILDKLSIAEPKTKLITEILDSLGIESTAIIGVAIGNDYITMASSNVPGIKTTMVSMLNVADLLSYKTLLLDVDAVKRIEQLWDKKKTGKSKEKAG